MTKLDPNKSIEALLERKVELELKADSPQYLRSIEDGNYIAALEEVEKQLTETPKDVRARLFWVECQLREGQVPVTALITPLEEIIDDIRKTDNLLLQSTLTYLRAAIVLYDRGQSRLSVTVMQWANEFAESSNKLTKEELMQLRSFYLSSLEEEIDKAATRRESKAYIEGLKKEFSELQKKYKSASNARLKKTSSKKRRVFNSKSIIQEANSKDAEETESLESKHREGLSFTGVLIWFLSLTVLAFGGFYLFENYYPLIDYQEIDNRLAMSASTPSVELDLPILKKHLARIPEKKSDDGSSFDGVKKRLNQLQQVAKTAEQKKEGKTTKPYKKSGMPKGVRKDLAAQIQADMERERKRLEAKRNKEIQENTPSLDPNHFKNTPIQELEPGKNKHRREDLNISRQSMADLHIARNGRVYGKPLDGDLNGSVGVSPIDGSPVAAIEVYEYKETTYFRTITGTEVFSRPSLLANSLAHLEPDAKIQVVAKIGEWLELVSTGGRRGYIYAQDAVRVKSK